ncbi:MAG: TIM barrel protein, partial [Acidobacteria bacterium]|nr:TIM barrel protein [Acidobacteriota bacterium]
CSSGEETAAETKPQQAQSPEAGKAGAMKLSLSVRVAEKFANKKEASLTIDELIALAVKNGYQALCLRASQAGVQTPAETVRQMSGKIHDAGLAVSMVTGDFFVPQNDEHGPDCLRNITPYLDLADAFQANLIRICMKKDEDIAWAQKASDEAQERNIRLAHQSHDASMFETVDGSLDVLKKVGRPNFGLIYEPANWLIVDEPYVEGIGKLKDYIFNVYVQNHHLNPNAEAAVTTWKKGQVHLEHIGLWQEGGVRFEDVCAALHGIGYQGYVTVHQAFEGVMSVQDAVERSADYLRPLIT